MHIHCIRITTVNVADFGGISLLEPALHRDFRSFCFIFWSKVILNFPSLMRIYIYANTLFYYYLTDMQNRNLS